MLQEELDALSSDSEDEGGKQDLGGAEDDQAAVASEDEETEDIRSTTEACSKTVAGLNQDGQLVEENIIDDVHENKTTGVECGFHVEIPDATVILRKLQEKHQER